MKDPLKNYHESIIEIFQVLFWMFEPKLEHKQYGEVFKVDIYFKTTQYPSYKGPLGRCRSVEIIGFGQVLFKVPGKKNIIVWIPREMIKIEFSCSSLMGRQNSGLPNLHGFSCCSKVKRKINL